MKSDKMQMSYVPQTSEHVKITSVSNGSDKYDIKIPKGSFVSAVNVLNKAKFTTATANIKVGTAADDDYYKAAAIDVGNSSTPGMYVGLNTMDAAKMMEPVAADQIVRFTVTGGAANTAGVVYVWVEYRFDENIYPTQLV